jgi:hypothetical protein
MCKCLCYSESTEFWREFNKLPGVQHFSSLSCLFEHKKPSIFHFGLLIYLTTLFHFYTIGSTGKLFVNSKYKRLWKEVVMAYLSYNSSVRLDILRRKTKAVIQPVPRSIRGSGTPENKDRVLRIQQSDVLKHAVDYTGDSRYTRGSRSCESPRITKTRSTGNV